MRSCSISYKVAGRTQVGDWGPALWAENKAAAKTLRGERGSYHRDVRPMKLGEQTEQALRQEGKQGPH